MIACLLIRHFGATVERLHDPALRSEPLILATGGRVRRVIATSARPAAAGVKKRVTLRQAELLFPNATVLPANQAVYRRIADEAAERLLQYANKVEPEYQPTSAAFYLDNDKDLETTQAFLARWFQTEIGVGVAANKFVARVAAGASTHTGQIERIAPGAEANFLAGYSVTLLPLDKEMTRRLPLLGVYTLGDLARLPRYAVWEQFPKRGRWVHDLASGVDIRAIQCIEPPLSLCAQQAFEPPVADREILKRVLRKLGGAVFEQLDKREAHQVMLRLSLDNRSVIETHIQPHQPARTLIYLLRRLEDLLERQLILAAVENVEVRLLDIQEPAPVQLSLFDHLQAQQAVASRLPEWKRRHRDSRFLRAALERPGDYTPLEAQFELYEATGA